MSTPSNDETFLSHPRDYVGHPLRGIGAARRVLFMPGLGLGLGDQFMCIPLIQSLRDRFRHARIDLVTGFPQFWNHHAPDAVRVYASASIHADALKAMCCGQRYDLAIVGYVPGALNGFAEAACPTIFCAGSDLARFRAFYTSEGRCFEIPLTATKSCLNEAHRFTALFEDFGIVAQATAPPGSHLDRIADAPELSGARVLLHPGTGKPYKCWPLANWRELARLLGRRGARVVVSSGIGEADYALAERVSTAGTTVTQLPQVPLAEFLDRLAEVDVVVSADTFLPHAVTMMPRPLSYALYGPTDPLRFCPWGSRHFFGSIEASPSAVVQALDTLLRAAGARTEAVSAGDAAALVRAAAALVERLTQLESVHPVSCALCLESLRLHLAAFHDALSHDARPVLWGDEALYRRIFAMAGAAPLTVLAEAFAGSPALRGAQLLLDRALLAAPTRCAAGIGG